MGFKNAIKRGVSKVGDFLGGSQNNENSKRNVVAKTTKELFSILEKNSGSQTKEAVKSTVQELQDALNEGREGGDKSTKNGHRNRKHVLNKKKLNKFFSTDEKEYLLGALGKEGRKIDMDVKIELFRVLKEVVSQGADREEKGKLMHTLLENTPGNVVFEYAMECVYRFFKKNKESYKNVFDNQNKLKYSIVHENLNEISEEISEKLNKKKGGDKGLRYKFLSQAGLLLYHLDSKDRKSSFVNKGKGSVGVKSMFFSKGIDDYNKIKKPLISIYRQISNSKRKKGSVENHVKSNKELLFESYKKIIEQLRNLREKYKAILNGDIEDEEINQNKNKADEQYAKLKKQYEKLLDDTSKWLSRYEKMSYAPQRIRIGFLFRRIEKIKKKIELGKSSVSSANYSGEEGTKQKGGQKDEKESGGSSESDTHSSKRTGLLSGLWHGAGRFTEEALNALGSAAGFVGSIFDVGKNALSSVGSVFGLLGSWIDSKKPVWTMTQNGSSLNNSNSDSNNNANGSSNNNANGSSNNDTNGNTTSASTSQPSSAQNTSGSGNSSGQALGASNSNSGNATPTNVSNNTSQGPQNRGLSSLLTNEYLEALWEGFFGRS